MNQSLNIVCNDDDFNIKSASLTKPVNEVSIDLEVGENTINLTLTAHQAARIMLMLEDIGVRKIHAVSSTAVPQKYDEIDYDRKNVVILTKFNVGDKVELINIEEGYEILENEIGTIMKYDEKKMIYAVYFDIEDESGELLHNCDGFLSANKAIWAYEEELELRLY